MVSSPTHVTLSFVAKFTEVSVGGYALLSDTNSGMPISLGNFTREGVINGGGGVKFTATPAVEILCNSQTYDEVVHIEY